MPRSRPWGESSPNERESIWTEPEMAASGFPISWASPAARVPTAAIRSFSRTSSSSFRHGVRSWKMTIAPVVTRSAFLSSAREKPT